MASVTALVTIKRGGKYHPPGSVFHDFAEQEVEALVGFVERFQGATAIPVEVALPATAGAAPSADEAPALQSDGALSEEEPEVEEPVDPNVVDVANAILLLEEADFEDDIPRRAPLTDILGYEPTAEMIAAAMALNGAH